MKHIFVCVLVLKYETLSVFVIILNEIILYNNKISDNSDDVFKRTHVISIKYCHILWETL